MLRAALGERMFGCMHESSTGTTVRPAVVADAEGMGSVHVRAWQEAYRGMMPDPYLDALSIVQRTQMWRGALESPSVERPVWLAERDGRVVGFTTFGPARRPDESGAFELYSLNVDPSAYRSGVGRLLLATFHDHVQAIAQSTVVLWVVRENVRARAFYERQGYRTDGAESHDEVLGAQVVEVRYRRSLGPTSNDR